MSESENAQDKFDVNTLVADYDQLTVGSIESRIRSLSEEQLAQVIEHEKQAANRPHVLLILSARSESLRNGAEPSSGDPTAAPPVSGTAGTSAANPSQAPEGTTPLRHGVAEQTPARGKP
ncbi:MAG: hypothetical protein WBQ44_20480 [Rhodococcus sp. (in: high G+C Gram-positive bacteria)]